MPQKQLSHEQAVQFLTEENVGHLATTDSGGAPYITPLHYIYRDGKIYFHCANEGQKLANIAANPRVCFAVDRLHKLVFFSAACKASSRYTSVLVFGMAEIVTDLQQKLAILETITAKLAEGRAFPPIPAAAAAGCTVVAIRIETIHGKQNVDPAEP